MKIIFSRLTLVILLFFVTCISALDLGKVQLQSILNQPLQAEVKLTDIGSTPLEALSVSLGSNEQFEAMGLTREAFDEHLHFTLRQNEKSEPTLIISSDTPVTNPIIELVLNVNVGQEQIEKRITLLVDPVLSETPSAMPASLNEATPQESLYEPSDLVGFFPLPSTNKLYSLPVGADAEQLHHQLVPEIKWKEVISSPVIIKTVVNESRSTHWFLFLAGFLVLLTIFLSYRYRKQFIPPVTIPDTKPTRVVASGLNSTKQVDLNGKIEVNMTSLLPLPTMDVEKDPEISQLTLAQAFLELGGTIEAKEILEKLAKSENPFVLPQVKELLESINTKKL